MPNIAEVPINIFISITAKNIPNGIANTIKMNSISCLLKNIENVEYKTYGKIRAHNIPLAGTIGPG